MRQHHKQGTITVSLHPRSSLLCPLAPLHAMVLNISTASSLVDKVTLLPSPSRNDFPAY